MIVIKIGGGADINHRAIFEDLRRLLDRGERAIVVHGANHEMAELSARLGHEPCFVRSVSGQESRYTDAAAMEIFQMAYCGKVNKTLVTLCQALGINAVGLAGLDGRLLLARRKQALRVVEASRRRIIRDDLSGKVESVNTALLDLLLGHGYLPLICPPALGDESQALNVDGDRAAAMIAAAMKAERLVIFSNVPGLLRDKDDEATLISEIAYASIGECERFAQGRMKKKIMGAAEALSLGVGAVVLADGRTTRPLEDALNGRGTLIHRTNTRLP
ncbi:MAG: [LysW]-aminoadipate kinase [Phycisphaerae bacterium]|jgi:acetylglutamate/LysW-gamma-L-alpha-aminoadipate kinase